MTPNPIDFALRVCESIAFGLHAVLGIIEPWTGCVRSAFRDNGAMPLVLASSRSAAGCSGCGQLFQVERGRACRPGLHRSVSLWRMLLSSTAWTSSSSSMCSTRLCGICDGRHINSYEYWNCYYLCCNMCWFCLSAESDSGDSGEWISCRGRLPPVRK